VPWVDTVYYTGTGDGGNERAVGGKPNGKALTDNGWGLGGPTWMQGLNKVIHQERNTKGNCNRHTYATKYTKNKKLIDSEE